METKLDFRIKSKVENIYPIEREILDQAYEHGFDGDICFCLRLALDEALINAITHGNRNSEDKHVRVSVLYDSDQVSVTIGDEGEGFNYLNLTDPTQKPFLYETHGRGVFLIRQFTNEMRFNKKGNEITFTLNRCYPPAVLQSS